MKSSNLIELLIKYQPSYQDEQILLKILSKSGCTQPRFHSFFTAESQASFAHLKELVFLKADQPLEEKIRSFLKKRWAYITNTNASYISFPHSPINQICIQLAQAIVKPDEPLVMVLMPSLKITDYIELTEVTHDSKRELNFSNFILSDDGKAIIPIKAWFEAQVNNTGEFFNHLYSSNDQVVSLSPREQSQLRQSAMPASDEIFEEFAFRKQLLSGKGTLAEAVLILCDQLNKNGQSGKGSFKNAAPGAYVAIRVFLNIWYQILSQEQRDSLQFMGNNHYDTFRQILLGFHASVAHNDGFGILSQKDIDLIKNMNTCVESNAATLENIVNAHPEAFSKIMIIKSEAKVNQDSSSNRVIFLDSLLQNIQSNIDARNKAIQDYQSSKDPLSGENALRLHYTDNQNTLGESLAAYCWDLKSCLDEIPPYSIINYFELSYFQNALSDEELAIFLSRLTYYNLQYIYRHSLYHAGKFNEILLRQPFFTPDPSALHDAVKNNRVDLVKAFIQGKKCLDFTFTLWKNEDFSRTPLYQAILNKKQEIAALLIQAGARCMEKIGSDSFLFYALRQKLELVIDALLERKDIEINEEDSSGCTLLCYAALNHDAKRCETLIQKGALVNAADADGFTALHLAALNNNDETVKTLLKFEANKNLRNKINESPLAVAMQRKSLKTALILIEAGADLSETYGSTKKPIFVFASELNSFLIQSALLKRPEIKIDDTDTLNDTALSLATKRGDSPMVQFLLDHRAEINPLCKTQHPPLYHAIMGIPKDIEVAPGLNEAERAECTYRYIFIACALIKAGGDLNYSFKQNEIEYTLIEYASQNNMQPIFFAWFNLGNDPSILKAETRNILLLSLLGKTPYENSFEKYIKALVMAGATYPDFMNQLDNFKIHFELHELLINPSLDKLKSLHKFKGLRELCHIEPESENALKLYAACQEMMLRKLPEQIDLANNLHRAIHADSLDDLCTLMNTKQMISSSYSRAEPAVNLWAKIPWALKKIIQARVGADANKRQKLMKETFE